MQSSPGACVFRVLWMNAERQTETSELPAPSAALTIVRTGAQALCVALGRRKAEKFLREWARIASSEESIRMLFPTRSASEREAVREAQLQALAWLRQALPSLIASLPPE